MGGGGVLVLVRKEMDYVEDAFPDVNKGCESVWLQKKLFNANPLNKASLYRAPIYRNEYSFLV